MAAVRAVAVRRPIVVAPRRVRAVQVVVRRVPPIRRAAAVSEVRRAADSRVAALRAVVAEAAAAADAVWEDDNHLPLKSIRIQAPMRHTRIGLKHKRL